MEQSLEHRIGRSAEKAFGGRGSVGSADKVVVDDGERGELAITEAMAPVMMERQLAVATLYTGAAALEQVGALAGELLEVLTFLHRKPIKEVPGLSQGGQE